MDNVCAIYLVRHAKSEANHVGIIGGDSNLIDEGVNQALELGEQLKDVNFAAVFTSDLKRAVQTAQNIIKGKDLAIQQVHNLRERSFGSLENKSNKEYLHLFQALKEMTEEEIWQWKIVDDMETSEQSVKRFEKALKEIGNKYIGKKVLVVSHGNTIRGFLVKLGFATFNQLHGDNIGNACCIEIKFDGQDYVIVKTSGVITNP